jgi:hypothetical protein
MKDSADAKAHPEGIGRRRATAGARQRYLRHVQPDGMPRAILYPDPVELIVPADRIYQHFQWG